MNIAQFLMASSRLHPDRPALCLGARTVATFSQLANRVSRIGNELCRYTGNRPGARVVIFSANCPQYIEVMWASWHVGLCVVPVNAKLHPRELAYIIENAGATLCFVDEERRREIDGTIESIGECTFISFSSEDYLQLEKGNPVPVAESRDDDLAWLFYTSGTTGKPKGAMLTHRNLFSMTLRHFPDLGEIRPGDHLLHAAPISHSSGLLSLAYMARGGCNVVPESGAFKEHEVFDLIDHFERSSLFLAPTMVNRLSRHTDSVSFNKEHLGSIIYGGAPMYLEDIRRSLAVFGPRLVQIYGQGETPNTISYLSQHIHADVSNPHYEAILNSVGVPRMGIEVRVVDEDDREVPAGRIGQVLVRSEVTMAGYWNNPAASASTLKDGWLHTGDLGCFDALGYLSLKDRAKDVIISGGSNIYPREVEEVVLLHAGVLETAVIGRPSPEWGEEVIAFVVCREEHLVTAADLDALCLQHIARFKRPKAYRFVDRLPKSNYGKILKTELREWAKVAEGAR